MNEYFARRKPEYLVGGDAAVRTAYPQQFGRLLLR